MISTFRWITATVLISAAATSALAQTIDPLTGLPQQQTFSVQSPLAGSAVNPGGPPDVGEPPTGLPTLASERTFYPMFDVRHDANDGVGYTTSFTSVGLFLPLPLAGPRQLTFVDARAILSNTSKWSANFGVGHRLYAEELDRVFGLYAYYDFRDTGPKSYNQLALGLETLGEDWDLRSNFYFPIGQTLNKIDDVFTNPFFQSNNIFFIRNEVLETAMTGFDVEWGRSIWEAIGLRGYVGAYAFFADETPNAYGAKVRAEAMASENLRLQLGLQSDQVFGTNLNMAVSFQFPARSTTAANVPVLDRLDDPVERLFNIPTTRPVRQSQVAATDVGTGLPIRVFHVNNTSAPSLAGTFESPFNNLKAAEAASDDGDIIFVRRGDGTSNGMNAGIVLKNRQRLLGDGVQHRFTAEQGTFDFPGFTPGPFPIITGPGDVVRLASFNEVGGFTIPNAGRAGIFGQNITGFDLHDLVITGSLDDAVRLQNASGVGDVRDVVFQNNVRNGMRVINTTNSSLQLNVNRSNMSFNGTGGTLGSGLFLDLADTVLNINVQNSVFNNNSRSGMSIITTGASTVNANILNNIAQNNGSVLAVDQHGIFFSGRGTTNANLLIQGNNASFNGQGSGIFLQTDDNAILNATVFRNIANNNGVLNPLNTFNVYHGIGFEGIGAQIANLIIDSNTLNNNTQEGVRIENQIVGTSTVRITRNSIANSGQDGIRVLNANESAGGAVATTMLDIGFNTINNSGNTGILVFTHNQVFILPVDNTSVNGRIVGNVINGAANDGIQVTAFNLSNLGTTESPFLIDSNTITGALDIAIDTVAVNQIGGTMATPLLFETLIIRNVLDSNGAGIRAANFGDAANAGVLHNSRIIGNSITNGNFEAIIIGGNDAAVGIATNTAINATVRDNTMRNNLGVNNPGGPNTRPVQLETFPIEPPGFVPIIPISPGNPFAPPGLLASVFVYSVNITPAVCVQLINNDSDQDFGFAGQVTPVQIENTLATNRFNNSLNAGATVVVPLDTCGFPRIIALPPVPVAPTTP